jgi:hypothetical protein
MNAEDRPENIGDLTDRGTDGQSLSQGRHQVLFAASDFSNTG